MRLKKVVESAHECPMAVGCGHLHFPCTFGKLSLGNDTTRTPPCPLPMAKLRITAVMLSRDFPTHYPLHLYSYIVQIRNDMFCSSRTRGISLLKLYPTLQQKKVGNLPTPHFRRLCYIDTKYNLPGLTHLRRG